MFAADAFEGGWRWHFSIFQHDGDGGDEGVADVGGALFGGFSVVHGSGEFDALAIPFAVLEPEDDLVVLGDGAGAAEDGGVGRPTRILRPLHRGGFWI